jgi:prepilin-type N-terminal cleavage/methylation domain-containing protein
MLAHTIPDFVSSAQRGNRRPRPAGFSLLELVAVVTLLGVIAAVVMIRVTGVDKNQVKKTACDSTRGEIDLQVRLWLRTKGAWPAANLSDIGADTNFFPRGVPRCPVDGSDYTLDTTTHTVTGHSH